MWNDLVVWNVCEDTMEEEQQPLSSFSFPVVAVDPESVEELFPSLLLEDVLTDVDGLCCCCC